MNSVHIGVTLVAKVDTKVGTTCIGEDTNAANWWQLYGSTSPWTKGFFLILFSRPLGPIFMWPNLWNACSQIMSYPRCKGHVEGSTDGVDFFIFYFWNKISRTCKSYNVILICDKTCAPKLGNVPKLDTMFYGTDNIVWNIPHPYWIWEYSTKTLSFMQITVLNLNNVMLTTWDFASMLGHANMSGTRGLGPCVNRP